MCWCVPSLSVSNEGVIMSVPVSSGSAETVKRMCGAPQSAQERKSEPLIRAC